MYHTVLSTFNASLIGILIVSYWVWWIVALCAVLGGPDRPARSATLLSIQIV